LPKRDRDWLMAWAILRRRALNERLEKSKRYNKEKMDYFLNPDVVNALLSDINEFV